MTSVAAGHSFSKPLPPPARDDKLPAPPPSDDRASVYSPPLPPPKSAQDDLQPPSNRPQLLNIPPVGSLDPGLVVPLTPTTPITPTTPSSSMSETKPKKSNPLNDLIDTEKSYVDYLTGIIRKVAAAWSRSNLPPPELDTMFRSIEGVYKANRSLLMKLKEIGTNPSSPKALGDLLMRWIDDLEGPYTTYCSKYSSGFDHWDPVQSNPKLAQVVINFSASNPPPSSSSSSSEPPTWTLDALFLLPKARLKYYKKLYNRLLKSTTPGRSDHRLLVGALDKLDRLLDTLEQRERVQVGSSPSSRPSEFPSEDEVVVDMRSQRVSGPPEPTRKDPRLSDAAQSSGSSSARGSSVSGGERLSRETASTSISRGSSATMSMPISDLERRLSAERTLDIFTMKSKVVRLQMSPPQLTYTRELRFSIDVVARLTPRATGVEVVHRQGHIFLLSDLFLVCERMTAEERAQFGPDGPDMWLCYPPLAGKVLRVSEVPGQDNALQVAIMRKETLILQAENSHVRDFMLSEFKECIDFASSVGPVSKQPPPPMPSLNGMNGLSLGGPGQRSPAPLSAHTSPPSHPNGLPNMDRSSGGSMSPPGSRVSSPPIHQPNPNPNNAPSYRLSDPRGPPSNDLADRQSLTNQPQRTPSLQNSMYQPPQRAPSLQNPMLAPPMMRSPPPGAGPAYPNYSNPGQVGRSASAGAPMMHDASGQVGRSASAGAPIMHDAPGQRYGPGGPPGPPFHEPMPNGPGQPYPPRQPGPYGPAASTIPRSPSEPGIPHGMRKSPSTRSLHSQYEQPAPAPPIPSMPQGGYQHNNNNFGPRSLSNGALHAPQPRPLLPSAQFNARTVSSAETSFVDPSPPGSPVEETIPTGPVTTTVSAQMKCKVFLKQQHAQWKSLGSAKLKLYRQDPTNIKQLVVEADDKNHSVLISTIVLTDGVERVGKTGVAIELSDQGARTGIVYMIQLRNENSAGGLYDSLLAGSDRAARG